LTNLVALSVLALGCSGGGEKSSSKSDAARCESLLVLEDSYTVGFAQSHEPTNPWRSEENRSMSAEAELRGYKMIYTQEDASDGRRARNRLPVALIGRQARPTSMNC